MKIRTEEMLSADERHDMLEQIKEYYGFESQAEFARKIGVSTQVLNSWYTRECFNIELLAVKFPELSGDWLLRGERPMLKKDKAEMTVPATTMDVQSALAALAQEQKLTAKAQDQTDKIMQVMESIAASLKRLSKSLEQK